MADPRIVSLVPSGTDLVAELGLGDALVGVSHECDHPIAQGKPVLTWSTLPSPGGAAPQRLSAREIDRHVSHAQSEGQPLYRTDLEQLRRLDPDVVIAQNVCDVCAVDSTQLKLPDAARLVELTAATVDGLYTDLHRLGEATGRTQYALDVSERVRGRLARVLQTVGSLEPVRTLGLEWSDPPFSGGHWVPQMTALAGGEHVLTAPGEMSRRTDWKEIAEANPDVLVFMPCGYGLDAAVREARALASEPEPGALDAVGQGHLWATDATRLFSRCTPESVTRGTEVLAGLLHPEAWPRPAEDEAVAIR
jgi:iron complex transport system substrate-binding protein